MKGQAQKKIQGQQKTKLSKQLQGKLKYIRSTLIKLGCQLIPSEQKNSSQYLSMCMQASDSRLQLIEWLIAIIYPGYNLDSDYKNSYDDDPHTHKVKRLKIVLWQVGVMPMSKHTKNLDYQKYVSGLLGYESAVNLIYDLCELGQSKFSANIHKIEQKTGDLLGQLIKHHNELVNVSYDPYGVTFPPKFNHNSFEDYAKINEAYDKLIGQIKDATTQQKQNVEQNDATALLDELDGYKQLFARKYQKLCEGMDRMIARYENIVPTQDAKQIAELHNKRIINISRDLCKGYRSYSKMLNQIKTQQVDASIKDLKNEVINLINGINEVPHIFQ